MTISKKRMAEIEAIADEDIDTSDIPVLDDAFFEKARLVLPGDRTTTDISCRRSMTHAQVDK